MGQPAVTLLEGYVWDIPEGPALADKAMRMTHESGGKVALSLSDSFCVERHRDAFHTAVRESVDIVMADEDEINELLQTENFDATLAVLDDYDNLFAMTRSEKGSVIPAWPGTGRAGSHGRGKRSSIRPAPATHIPQGSCTG